MIEVLHQAEAGFLEQIVYPALEILVVPSGEGDGRYPVRELHAASLRGGSDTVGLQIAFIMLEPVPP